MLRHHLKHPQRKQRDWLEKVRAEGRLKRTTPEAAESKDPAAPEVLPESALMWRLFVTLSGQRMSGNNGPQPIPISEIYAIGMLEELSFAEIRWLVELVQTLDRIYLEDTYKKIQTEAEKQRKKAALKRRG